MNLKTLVRGDEKAVVEAGSQGEAEMKAVGFEDPEADAAEPKPDKAPKADAKKGKK